LNDYNVESLRSTGTDYFKDSLFPEEEETIEYSKERIPIGTKRDGNTYYYDLRIPSRCIFLGKTQTGKTYSMRSFADRLNLAGYTQVFLPDVKDEYKSSRRPSQAKFRDNLLPGEKPCGMKIITLRPTFYKPFETIPAQHNYYYSENPNSLTRNDFMTLLNSEEMTSPQKTVLELLYEHIRREKAEFNIEQIDGFLDELSEITNSQRTSLKLKFRPLMSSQFYIPRYERDIIGLLQKGMILSINMEGFDNFGKGGFLYPEVMVGLVLRKIINARRQKRIGPVWVHVDEASRFIPVNRNPSCKNDFIESSQLDTRYGLYYSYAVQHLSMIPESIVSQCRYVFVPYTAEPMVIKEALEMTGLLKNTQSGTNQALRLKRSLQKYDWAVFDKTNMTIDIIRFLSPLSWHMQAGE
jgi:hypothetical protein